MGSSSSKQKSLDHQLQDADPNDIKTIQTLLEQGANPNPTNFWKIRGMTPLASAAAADCIPTMELLFAHGAKTDTWVPQGQLRQETPLNAAITAGKVDAVRLLLSHGADVNQHLYSRPLTCAAEALNIPVLKALLEAGADPTKADLHMSPAKMVVWNYLCYEHSLYEPPKEGCEKCGNRWLWVAALCLLREHGGKAMAREEGGASIEDVYADTIAYITLLDKRRKIIGRVVKGVTFRDPDINQLLMMGASTTLSILQTL